MVLGERKIAIYFLWKKKSDHMINEAREWDGKVQNIEIFRLIASGIYEIKGISKHCDLFMIFTRRDGIFWINS